MKFNTLFLSALLGFAIADEGDHKDKIKDGLKSFSDRMKSAKDGMKNRLITQDQRQCHRMSKLNHLMELSNNQTRMARIENNYPDRAQKIKDEAAKAGPELSVMQRNSTLTKYCGQYNAHERLRHQCRTLKHGEKLVNRLKNNTALEESAKRRNKSVDEIRGYWQKEVDHVSKLKSNKTLVDQCTKMKNTKDKDAKKADKGKDKNDKNDKGHEKGAKAEKHKSAAAHVQVAGTGAFALGLSLLVASLMF